MPDLLRRVAVLTVLSAVGIALIAPLTARSAMPDAHPSVERLLGRIAVFDTGLDRGSLAGRGTSSTSTMVLAVDAPASGAELIAFTALPTPATAPMEATLYPVATPEPAPARARSTPSAPAGDPAPTGEVITGNASWYCHKVGTCPAGYTPADAFVALPGAFGGAGGRGVVGHVTVCADRCVDLPAVDYCNCYWGLANQRIVDLSAAAWALVTDTPRSAGILQVTMHLGS